MVVLAARVAIAIASVCVMGVHRGARRPGGEHGTLERTRLRGGARWHGAIRQRRADAIDGSHFVRARSEQPVVVEEREGGATDRLGAVTRAAVFLEQRADA